MQELVSSSFCQQQNNIRTVSPAVGIPASFTSGAHQTMLDIMAVSSIPNPLSLSQLLTSSRDSSAQWSQRQQTFSYADIISSEANMQHLSRNLDNDVNFCDDKMKKDHPLLLRLLTNPDNGNNILKPSQQVKTLPSDGKKYLDDVQIIQLIEVRRAIYRVQMEKLKGLSVKDSLNTTPIPCCSPQVGPSTTTFAPREADDHILEDKEKTEASDCRGYSPEESTMKNSDTARQSAGTPFSNTSQHLQFFDRDSCIASECTNLKVKNNPLVNSIVLMDISTVHYSLAALKELISSLDNVETPQKQIFVDNILQTFWNGKMDNVHLFTSTEYAGIMLETAAICAKKGESQFILETPGSKVEDLISHNPTLTLNYKPSEQEYKSTWRDNDGLDVEVDPCSEDRMKAVDNLQTSSAIVTVEKQKEPKECLPQYTTNSENVKTPSGQNVDLAERLSVPERNDEPEQEVPEREVRTEKSRGIFDYMCERLNLKYNDIVDPQMYTCSTSSQKNDSTDGLNPIQQKQPSVNLPPLQFEDISDDEKSVIEFCPEQMEATTPPAPSPPGDNERSLKQQLSCPHAYFIETDDGDFEEALCPECVQAVSLQNQEEDFSVGREPVSKVSENEDLPGHSHCTIVMDLDSEEEDDDDDWLVVPLVAIDVKLEQGSLHLDENDGSSDTYKCPLSKEQSNSSSSSPIHQIDTFDNWDSFTKLFGLKPPEDTNATVEETAFEPALAHTSNTVQEVILEPDLAHTSATVEGIFEPALAHTSTTEGIFEPTLAHTSTTEGIFEPTLAHTSTTVEEGIFEPSSAHCIEIEDSCDTDDSADYPRQAQPNYLTASYLVRAPSPLLNSEEEDEVSQPPDCIMPTSPPQSTSHNDFFPNLSTDDEDYSGNNINNTSFPSTNSGKHCKKTFKTKHAERSKSNTLQKKRLKRRVITSDSEDEHDEDSRNYFSESSKTSALPKQTAPISWSAYPGPEKSQNSVSSKVSSQTLTVKRKRDSTTSTSDAIQKEKVKRQRSSLDAERSVGHKLSNKSRSAVKLPTNNAASDCPKYKTSNQSKNTMVSETVNRSLVARQMSQPLPNQGPPLTNQSRPQTIRTLSLNGAPYKASSLPGSMQSQSNTKSNQLNSYSTKGSTAAKQRLVQEWENEHVPSRKERTIYDRDANARKAVAKAANETRAPAKHPPRQRRTSNDRPLMKRIKSQARELTNQTHHQGPPERNPEDRLKFSGYKWHQDHLSTTAKPLHATTKGTKA